MGALCTPSPLKLYMHSFQGAPCYRSILALVNLDALNITVIISIE